MNISLLDQTIVIVYFLGMIAIGASVASRIRSFDQFIIAGRQLSVLIEPAFYQRIFAARTRTSR